MASKWIVNTVRGKICNGPALRMLLLPAALVATCVAARDDAVVMAIDDDLTTILARLYSADGPPSPCAGDAAHSSTCSTAQHFASSMQSDGSWPDLNYKKPIATDMLPVEHWERLASLGRAVHCSGCTASGHATALQASIAKGIGFWRKNDFLDPNWFVNDFAAPMQIEKLLVIMANATTGPPLATADAAYGITLLKRGTDPLWRPHGEGGHYTGENLVWSLQIDIQRGALTGNASLVQSAFTKMWASIAVKPHCTIRHVGDEQCDGLMADGSFHQHGPLLQSGSYGSGLMNNILSFIELSSGTDFAIPAEPLKVFVRYLTMGQCNMLRAGQGVEVASWNVPPRGRDITNTGNGPFPSATVAKGIDAVLQHEVDPASKAELQQCASVLRGELPPPTRTRHFPDSDYTTHHRPGFSQDVRTWSFRTENAECVNAENQLGAHLADGAAYTMVSGTEYNEIFPVWEWRKVPGVLARQEHEVAPPCHFEQMGATQFVGGVEMIGLNWAVVAMDFAHGPPSTCVKFDGLGDDTVHAPCEIHSDQADMAVTSAAARAETLTAKRAWFMIDEGFVSLTAGVTLGASDASVAVTLEQSLLNGSVAVYNLSGPGQPQAVPTGNSSWPLENWVGDKPGAGAGAGTGAIVVSHRNISYVALKAAATMPSTWSSSSLPTAGAAEPAAVAPTLNLRASVGPQSGSWHKISTERTGGDITKDVFTLWLDLGSAPLTGGSAGYAVMPGLMGQGLAAALERIQVLANTEVRQVLSAKRGPGPEEVIMAAVYSGETIVSAKEDGVGFSLQTNNSLIVAIVLCCGDRAKSVSFAFSRPIGGATTVRLTASGPRMPALVTNTRDPSSNVHCSGHTIDLTFPKELGRTATGSCVASSS